ncbi:putative secreted protein [Streptomyces davaonensis JCM 4913]|uniref:Putative secreted protein n=1 Tax=Streptomyces davaonensis (strain DSM 101723 / JCM 4913 / KCC S-0913 / 768) TaxID=1214101 RepID=K4QV76_STRDJ|nr:hypothetical protein [Streptomyces davaonensis]CCK24908.1 putative secreted protein [Streptomyces davaonensis JCM 4913]
MRSARALLATAGATAVLLLGAPGGYAADGDRDHEDNSFSKEHDGGRDFGHDSEDSWGGKKHDKEDDWSGKHEDDSWKDGRDHDSWKGDHHKPKGGMHTGGGGLATPTVTAGGLAVLAVAGTGLYAARRRKATGSAA